MIINKERFVIIMAIKLPESYPAKIKLTNTLKIEDQTEKVFNTGMSSVGTPHIDEPIDKTGVGAYDAPLQELPKISYGTIPVLVWENGGQFVTLNPGENITITVKEDREAVYYLQQASDALAAEIVAAGG